MEPTTEEQIAEQQRELERQQQHLQASLTIPVSSPTTSENGSTPSAMRSILELLEAQSARVDQLGRILQSEADLSAKQRVEELETMRLMQAMIVEFDKVMITLTEGIERQETVTAALVRVSANLSQIVAALVGPPPEKA